jgi:hypothetical protein
MTPKQIIAHWAEYGPGMDAVSRRNLCDLALGAIDDLIDDFPDEPDDALRGTLCALWDIVDEIHATTFTNINTGDQS